MFERSAMTRRGILRAGAAVAAGTLVGGSTVAAPAPEAPTAAGARADGWHGLKVGLTTYTFKQRKLEPTIEAIKKVGLQYVSIKDFHLPLKSTAAERKEVADQFRAAGITPASCGVIYLKNSEAECRQAFEYARDAGIPTIVCAPTADALPLLEKLVKEFGTRLAIHNHGPGDKLWPTPNEIWPAIEKLDERIGFCIDVGHTARAGVDPAEAIRKYKARLYDLHFKDVYPVEPKGKAIEVGRGGLDVRAMLQALLDIGYAHCVNFEHEKDLETDPLPGLAESVGYVRGVLACIAKA